MGHEIQRQEVLHNECTTQITIFLPAGQKHPTTRGRSTLPWSGNQWKPVLVCPCGQDCQESKCQPGDAPKESQLLSWNLPQNSVYLSRQIPTGVQLHRVGPPCTKGNWQDKRYPTQSSQIHQVRLPIQKPRLCHSYAPGARSNFTARKKTTKEAYLPVQDHRRTSPWYWSGEMSNSNPQQKIDKTNNIWEPSTEKCSTTICQKPLAMLSHPALFNTCLQKQLLPKNNRGMEQLRQQCCLCRNRGWI